MKTTVWYKLLDWIVWLSAGGGVFFIGCAVLCSILPRYTVDRTLEEGVDLMFGVDHRVNFFIISSCFFLITLCAILLQIRDHLIKK